MTAKTPITSEDIEGMKSFIEFIKPIAQEQSKKGGNGFEEEMLGLDFKKSKDDKNALYMSYISIYKGFDAPAVYQQTAVILRKYKLYDEELWVLDQGISVLQNKLKELLEKYGGKPSELTPPYENVHAKIMALSLRKAKVLKLIERKATAG